ncbi:MAG: hypothetical protein KY432_10045 [Acidobacteria bacterium]|nr:hypothetical protein [Acidobacteriota bacterium]
MLTVLLVLLVSVTAGAERPRGEVAVEAESPVESPSRLTDLGWLVGHWRGEALGGVAEEVWLEPEGGAMAGIFRLVQKGEVVLYEIFTIREKDLVLTLKHFNSDLTGWEERSEVVTFAPVRFTESEAIFDDLAFRLLPDGRLHASVRTSDRDGNEDQLDFFLEPVGKPRGGQASAP